MTNIRLDLDMSQLKDLVEEVEGFHREVEEAAAMLAVQVHAHVAEEAQEKLKSRRETFLDNLVFEQVSKNTWIISVLEPAMWIEEGKPAGEMIDDLLGNNPKTSKDGHQYKVIPFKHNEGKAKQTPAQSSLTDTIRQEMRRQKIPWGKPVRDSRGNVKEGLVAKFDIADKPVKTQHGPGQGHGPIGKVKQGMEGTPFLQSVRVYQRLLKNSDGTPKLTAKGNQRFEKDIMTFRTVSSKQKGSGKWVHPGSEPMGFLDEAEKWAEDQWDNEIVPALLRKIGRSR